MYGDRAEYYDLIYAFKDYGKESEALHRVLNDLGVVDGASLLEAGCGTGSHLVHFERWYRAAGFDSSSSMAALARRKLQKAEVWQADMSAFSVEQPVDVLICLFGGIAYVHPQERLEAAAACFARAVRIGGVLVIEPFVSPERFVPGRPYMNTYDSPELKLCRMGTSRLTGDIAQLSFHWMALRPESEVEVFSEQHALRLAPAELLLDVFRSAGFEMRREENGPDPSRGLLVGRRIQRGPAWTSAGPGLDPPRLP
jgi:dTDP-3-amino-3,4,6-trideoxy-alpha-D-glucopyranose N,N-dimethyltransferase